MFLVGVPDGCYDLNHHGAKDGKNAFKIALVKLFVLLEELDGISESNNQIEPLFCWSAFH